MKANIDGTAAFNWGDNERVWRAYVKYNAGSYFDGKTPAQMRNEGNPGAAYADSIFNSMGEALP